MESDTHIPDALSPTALSPGPAVPAVPAGVVAANPGIVRAIVTNQLLFWALIIAQFGVVIFLSARVQRLAPATASLLFLGYSALTGTTLSIVLLAFTGESVAASSTME